MLSSMKSRSERGVNAQACCCSSFLGSGPRPRSAAHRRELPGPEPPAGTSPPAASMWLSLIRIHVIRAPWRWFLTSAHAARHILSSTGSRAASCGYRGSWPGCGRGGRQNDRVSVATPDMRAGRPKLRTVRFRGPAGCGPGAVTSATSSPGTTSWPSVRVGHELDGRVRRRRPEHLGSDRQSASTQPPRGLGHDPAVQHAVGRQDPSLLVTSPRPDVLGQGQLDEGPGRPKQSLQPATCSTISRFPPQTSYILRGPGGPHPLPGSNHGDRDDRRYPTTSGMPWVMPTPTATPAAIYPRRTAIHQHQERGWSTCRRRPTTIRSRRTRSPGRRPRPA